MDKSTLFVFIYLWGLQYCSCAKKRTCSLCEFAENVLEKVVTIEHKMEIMTDSVNELSKQVKDDIQKMKADLTDMSGNIQANWTEIRKELEICKGELVERDNMLNATNQKTITKPAGMVHLMGHCKGVTLIFISGRDSVIPSKIW